MTTEQSLTLRTGDKNIAAQLRESLAKIVDNHINFFYYDGAWQLGMEADEATMKYIVSELTACENYREGKFSYVIENISTI
jgi:hypothetical protein